MYLETWVQPTTSLQMGRWFGYRPGFENICRIHVTSGSSGDFQEVSDSVEELHADFQRMALLGKTPFEFGLKIRQSAIGIAITAANKMRTATAGSRDRDDARVWTHVPVGEVLRLIREIMLPQTEFNAFEVGRASLVGAYIEDMVGAELHLFRKPSAP
jgi:hypothetical protein